MNNTVLKRTIQIAFNVSPLNIEGRCSHVAFLVKSGKIIKIGFNRYKTVPITQYHPYHPGLVCKHAEVDVIFKAQKDDLSNYELVVVRINRNGKLAMSKPCTGCQSIIKQFGIKNVWYSTPDGTMEKMN